MRLLNIYSRKFEEFFENEIPPYYILSHRWSKEEISHQDYCEGRGKRRTGYQKIVDFCSFVKNRRERALLPEGPEGYGKVQVDFDGATVEQDVAPVGQHVWIDTCCIDKKSSAELSEAINSMWRWYSNASECIVHLADVPTWNDVGLSSTFVMDTLERRKSSARWGDLGAKAERVRDAFDGSDWFRRGWTLQELLAPKMIVFCNRGWEVIGHNCCHTGICCHNLHSYGTDLSRKVSRITDIPEGCLTGMDLVRRQSIAQRMSWASRRKTTRPEDEAYCLFGIFNVNMPLIYGEGHKAFRRLQEEIIQRSTGESILAWTDGSGIMPVLAESPATFTDAGSFEPAQDFSSGRKPYTLTSYGLEVRTWLWEIDGRDLGTEYGTIFLMELQCWNSRRNITKIALVKGQYGRFYRILPGHDERWKPFEKMEGVRTDVRTIYLDTGNEDLCG